MLVQGDRTDKKDTSAFNTWKDIIIPGNVEDGMTTNGATLVHPLPLSKRKFLANYLGRAQGKVGRLKLIELSKQFPDKVWHLNWLNEIISIVEFHASYLVSTFDVELNSSLKFEIFIELYLRYGYLPWKRYSVIHCFKTLWNKAESPFGAFTWKALWMHISS